MVRTQIHLAEEQYRKLRTMAGSKGVSIAEIIRRSVDNTLEAEIMPDRDELRARACAVFGIYKDIEPDVAENHDKYLPETYQA